MGKPKILIKNDLSKYAQCNFCLDTKNIIEVRGDRLTTVVAICKECAKKIGDSVN